MKESLIVQVINDGFRDPIPSKSAMANTINGLKRQLKTYKQSGCWICVAGNKEIVILDLYQTKHSFAILRYTEHEVIDDD